MVAAKDPSGTLDLRGYEHDGKQITLTTVAGGQSIKHVAVQMDRGSHSDEVIVGIQAPNNDLEVLAFEWGAPWWGDLEFAGNNVQSGYSAGSINAISMPGTSPGSDIITAVQGSYDELKLISWAASCPYYPYVVADCDLIREEDGSVGTASNIQIAKAPNAQNRYLTTHKTNNGDLRVTAWRRHSGIMDNVGSNLTSNESLGTAKKAALGFSQLGRAVTAMRDGKDELRIILWDIDW